MGGLVPTCVPAAAALVTARSTPPRPPDSSPPTHPTPPDHPQVLVLGSIEATFRRGAQLQGPQLRCWAPEGAHASEGSLATRCTAAGLTPLEASFFADRPLDARQLQPWPLLQALEALHVPCAAVLCFSTEGDNTADAAQLATTAAAVGGIAAAGQQQEQRWVPPASWQYVYGGAPAVY